MFLMFVVVFCRFVKINISENDEDGFMPEVRLTVSREIFNKFSKSQRKEFSDVLRCCVATSLSLYRLKPFTEDSITVHWDIPEESYNEDDLVVKIEFSVGGNGFNLSYDQLKDIASVIRRSIHRNLCFSLSYAVWLRPQQDGVWILKEK